MCWQHYHRSKRKYCSPSSTTTPGALVSVPTRRQDGQEPFCSMANKKQSSAKSTAPKKPLGHASKTSSFTARVVHATTCVLALSLAISTAKQVLTPLFGSVATNLVLHKAVLSSTLALALFRPRSSPTALGVVLTIAPAAFYQIGRLTSRRKDPFFGPIISYLPVLVPAILLTVGVVRDTLVSALPSIHS